MNYHELNKKVKNQLSRITKNMYNKTNLLKNRILEKQHERKEQCSKIWEFININDEKFVFGLFDNTIITLACYNDVFRKYF